MADTADTAPGTVANDSSFGTISWANPSNAISSDNSRAIATFSGAANSYYLKATNFGFSIPTNAVINGITVKKEGLYTGGSLGGTSHAKLVKGGGVTGDEKNGNFDLTEGVVTHGAVDDLWGALLTPADINSSDFGVALYTKITSGSGTIEVDSITISVNYTEWSSYVSTNQTRTFRIAKSGKDARFSTDPNDFIFDERYNTFKILGEGKLTGQTVNADPTTFSVAHGKSFTPTAIAFAKFPDGKVALPKEIPHTTALERYFNLEIDGTNLYFVFYKGATANYNVDIKYFIFETPAI